MGSSNLVRELFSGLLDVEDLPLKRSQDLCIVDCQLMEDFGTEDWHMCSTAQPETKEAWLVVEKER